MGGMIVARMDYGLVWMDEAQGVAVSFFLSTQLDELSAQREGLVPIPFLCASIS